MVLGFNHNLQYKGETFHVQTEDSGIANPHIVTLLYRGGVILCSQKTSYSDILKMESLEVVVAELMKEQHKNMMRRLKSGEFDDKAFAIKPQHAENSEILELEPEPEPVVPFAEVQKSPLPSREGESISGSLANETSDTPESLDDAVRLFFASNPD